ncbi:hypothetical protein KAR91_81155 [Candidatus Pacearchaeota archaeon]|nr:hypothetical protein [Candidatus Pacearchaeota archaeon]
MPNQNASTHDYVEQDYGDKEIELVRTFRIQLDDARNYFKMVTKPRLDRSYKLYIAYKGDRQRVIDQWQANVFVPYIHAVVETLKPRILDARPDFTVQGRTEADQNKAIKVQQLNDYTWEKSNMDNVSEMVVDSALIYGTGFMQVSYKVDKRKHKFLKSTDINNKKLKWVEEEKTFYDAPYCEWVDNYNLWHDWHNEDEEKKEFWFKRRVLTGNAIRRAYPSADKKRLAQALARGSRDLTDYGAIRNEVKLTHEGINKGDDRFDSATTADSAIDYNKYNNYVDPNLRMHEVFEWWRPLEDKYAVMINEVPILKGGEMPIPYDFKDSPFIGTQYLKLPNEYEGYGIPMLLESPQIMLNMIKNQRLDAMTLNIHKMWVVNPLANINKKELVTRPFGIVYSTDPNGVREIQFSDIKASAYKEEELLKSDMRYTSGVDDFSMGAGGGANSATEVRHLRESTLERVRMFINHLGDSYSKLMRYWISMYAQFFTEDLTIRVIGEDGQAEYPLIQRDDLMGLYDFKATVIPSIAGQNDIKKKQDMDLFQLLAGLPFIDLEKLTSKVLYDFDWSLDSVSKSQEQAPLAPPGMEGMPPEFGQSPISANIPPEMRDKVMGMIEGGGNMSPFAEAKAPINLLGTSAAPPTPKGVKLPTTNPRGLNMGVGGKVNTNIKLKENSNPEAKIARDAASIQKKKN